MNVQLLSIKPTQNWGKFNIRVKIGTDLHQFTMTVKITPIADYPIQVTQGDDSFLNVFKFNPIVALKISKLVTKFYNHQAVELPANVGVWQEGFLEPQVS